MSITSLSLRSDYWETFKVQEKDLEYLYNHLLELETPQTTDELASALIAERIRLEKENLANNGLADGSIYMPKGQYHVGDTLTFPALEWLQGEVAAIREGHHPEYPPFEVIAVDFGKGGTREFASGIETHILNQPLTANMDDPQLNPDTVFQKYGKVIKNQLDAQLHANPDLVQIAWRWFPRALLVDVNIGHLNLAEAVLDMVGGGPLPTSAILEQVELPTDVNAKLTEFSFNLALQEDERFDEVGPAGEILWYLKRLEPDAVQSIPIFLKYNPSHYDPDQVSDLMAEIDNTVVDELETIQPPVNEDIDRLTIGLIYPHWRAGTLPLTPQVADFFPTAYESPRVQFTFIDEETGDNFSGWVVRPHHYVYGLEDWYKAQNLMPGSLMSIQHGKKPGEVIISTDRHRSSREWIRTALIGADGGIVFAMLKQVVNAGFDERMAIAISDPSALDRLWESGNRPKMNVEQTVQTMMRELSKLNLQNNVHFQELYAAVNLIRRCPPGLILHILTTRQWAHHLGNLYFKHEDNKEEGT